MDRFDGIHQFLGVLLRDLNLACTAQLRDHPEGGMEVRVCLEVVGLEEVRPQDERLVLAGLGFLLLDRRYRLMVLRYAAMAGPSSADGAVRPSIFLVMDCTASAAARTRRVVDTAGSVAMGIGDDHVLCHGITKHANFMNPCPSASPRRM